MPTAKTLPTNHAEKYTHNTPFTIHKHESVLLFICSSNTQVSTAHYGCISGGKMHQSSLHTIPLDRSFVLVNKHNIIHPFASNCMFLVYFSPFLQHNLSAQLPEKFLDKDPHNYHNAMPHSHSQQFYACQPKLVPVMWKC